jgi:predicted MFS family arabinose efflux permease
MAAATLTLHRALPDHARQLDISYAAQMRGVAQVIRTQPVVRWRALLGGAAFGAFSGFWTTVTFLLAGPGFRFSQLGIGLFALVGAAGAITAVRLGRALDSRRHLRWAATGITLAGLVASFAVIGVGGTHPGTAGLVLLVVGVLAMDACVQGTHVLSQSVIYDLLPGARSRLTTVDMTTNFLGGAAGSAAAAQAWDHAGWTGATGVAEAFILLGLVCWLAVRRHETRRAT